MTRRQIDRFFRTLAIEMQRPGRVIVTGAAAGTLWGSTRSSLDVDFAIRVRGAAWEAIEAAIARTIQLTGLQANYAEDIDRWGLISLLDYTRHTRLYRRFGRLEVRLLDPAYWSIGKISRYTDPDIQDLREALRHQRVPVARLIKVWAAAVRASQRSEALRLFRQQAEHFFSHHGSAIWGRHFHAADAIRQFHRAAGIRPPPTTEPGTRRALSR